MECDEGSQSRVLWNVNFISISLYAFSTQKNLLTDPCLDVSKACVLDSQAFDTLKFSLFTIQRIASISCAIISSAMILLGFAENPVLVPDGTLLFHIVIILVMVFVLNATLFKPINRILEERERRTRGRSGKARDIIRDVEAKMAGYERALREARSEGYRLMEQERAEAMQERQAKLEVVREEVSRSVEVEKNAIAAQAGEARGTLALDAGAIAKEISAQILHRPVSGATISSLDTRI